MFEMNDTYLPLGVSVAAEILQMIYLFPRKTAYKTFSLIVK